MSTEPLVHASRPPQAATGDWLRTAFPVGARVVATAKYKRQFPLARQWTTGVVVGYGRETDLIRVLRDGTRTAVIYHRHFWDVIV